MSGTSDIDYGPESDHLTHCPRCGSAIDRVKTKPLMEPWKLGSEVIVYPCEHHTPIEVFRHAGKWTRVVGDSDVRAVKGGIHVTLRHSGEGAAPIAGDDDTVIMYDSTKGRREKLLEWDLDDAHPGIER